MTKPALNNGYVQVYTGNGKGKTTAALGLALRAAGAGLKVFIGQFVKSNHCSELDALKRFDDCISIKQYGSLGLINGNPTEKNIREARVGLDELRTVVENGEHDLVILEEANIAIDYKLIPIKELLDLIEKKPAHVELVLTGRHADPRIIGRADLVTEMKEVKHYRNQGIPARKGIEK